MTAPFPHRVKSSKRIACSTFWSSALVMPAAKLRLPQRVAVRA
jgi:hypothetical protein